MSARFWPGFRWRILAHQREGQRRKDGYTGETYDLHSTSLDGDWEFDELVIDHWFHLEQMNDRDWWIGIGNPEKGDYIHVNVSIDANRNCRISVEDESS